MKTLLIILAVVIVAFIITQLFALSTQRNIETYPYVVNKEYDAFEIRSYEATLFTSVQLTNNTYKDASSKGFSILAGYIFGGNEKNENRILSLLKRKVNKNELTFVDINGEVATS